jgi:hypothetical protein
MSAGWYSVSHPRVGARWIFATSAQAAVRIFTHSQSHKIDRKMRCDLNHNRPPESSKESKARNFETWEWMRAVKRFAEDARIEDFQKTRGEDERLRPVRPARHRAQALHRRQP